MGAWHDGVDVLDEWQTIGGDYKDVLGWTTYDAYRDEVTRRAPQVWVWTQTRLVHAWNLGLGCDDVLGSCCGCYSYWVTCARCTQVQPHCSEAPRVCRSCGGPTATLNRLLRGSGVESEVWL